ncbi:Methanogenic corrinoid protein MtbC1 [Natronincola peptidivorans]|uniref:Methanogenic corrinoid protein MtbC1 n=1 Tax=Natronincola peptidivorans TaxID=426128 RepID=A0A1H9ZMP2_9FIRM|nr:cobalamin-dependent protein [Natronincola peptidivorans]SES82923.1 Methanogenic corrinoid protein MtbC1 [Natronincola peptidivorans]
MDNFGDRLRELRLEKNLRQIDLAENLGLAQTTIANYEQNLRFPNEEILVKLADYFNISLDYLLSRETVVINTNNGRLSNTSLIDCNDKPISLSCISEAYQNALLDKEKPLAVKIILDAFQQGIAISDIYTKIFEPSLKRVGHRWECNQIHVSQEHFFSEMTQLIMSKLYIDSMPRYSKKHKIAALAANGEYHHIGIRMVTNLLELEGWKAYYLGINIPSDSIIKVIEEDAVDVVAISATMFFNVNSVEDLIRTIRSTESCKKVKIMVGGSAFNTDKTLWKQVGADAYASNAVEAVKVANGLVK